MLHNTTGKLQCAVQGIAPKEVRSELPSGIHVFLTYHFAIAVDDGHSGDPVVNDEVQGCTEQQ